MNYKAILALSSIAAALYGCTDAPSNAKLNWSSHSAPKIQLNHTEVSNIDGTAGNSRAVTDSAGNMFLVWEEYETQASTDTTLLCQRTNLVARKYSRSNRSWGGRTTLQTGQWRAIARNNTEDGNYAFVANGLNSEIQLGISGNNQVHAIWVQDTTDSCDSGNDIIASVYHARYVGSSSSWTTPELFIGTPDSNASKPVISVSSAGYALAAWQTWKKEFITDNGNVTDSGKRNSVIYTSHFDSVSTWSTPFIASGDDGSTPPNYYESDSVRATINANDNGAIAWRQLNNGIYELHALNYDATTGWASNSSQVNTSTDQVIELSITSNDSDNSWLAWSEADANGVTSIFVNSLASNGIPGTVASVQGDLAETTDDERNQMAFSPSIAVDSDSNISVAWLQQQDYGIQSTKWNITQSNALWSNHYEVTAAAWTGAGFLVREEQTSVIDMELATVNNIVALMWSQNNASTDKQPASVYSAEFSNGYMDKEDFIKGSWKYTAELKGINENIDSFSITAGAKSITSSWMTTDKDLKTDGSFTSTIRTGVAAGR